MLDAIGAGNPDYQGQDWGDVWANSPEHQEVTNEINRISSSLQSKSQVTTGDNEGEYAMPIWTQVFATTKRSFVAYWRTPNYAIVCSIQNSP